jgi:flap endonuclease-1
MPAWHAEPEVLRGDQLPPLKWVAADEEGMVQFLVTEKSFNEDRVRKAVQKMNASRSKATQGESLQSAACCSLASRHQG